eukprot:scaffold79317_cov36-Phaeocystis_antarctica.AAC.1
MDMSSLPLTPPPSLSSERSAFMWLAADSSRCSFLRVCPKARPARPRLRALCVWHTVHVASSPWALMRKAGDSGQKGSTHSWKSEKRHLHAARAGLGLGARGSGLRA